MLIIRIMMLEVFENSHFDSSLILELLLVSDHLERNVDIAFMVEHLQAHSERAFAQDANDLKSEGNVLTCDDFVVSSLIVPSHVWVN